MADNYSIFDVGGNIARGNALKKDYAQAHPNEPAPSEGMIGVFRNAELLQHDVNAIQQNIQTNTAETDAAVQDAQGEASRGATPPPAAADSPSGNLAAKVDNTDKGVELPKATDIPVPPTPQEVQNQSITDQGKRLSFDQSKVPIWWQSDSFRMGLFKFGLSLYSGNNIAQAFNDGAKDFTQNYGAEKRAAWADDLRAQGYPDDEIERYVQTGDNSVLTSPQERQYKAAQTAAAVANAQKAQYEASPEYREYEAKQQQFENQMKLTSAQNAAENSRISREELSLRKQALGGELAINKQTQVLKGLQSNPEYAAAAKEYQQRVNTVDQVNAAVDLPGNGWAANTALMNMLRNEAPSLGPRMSQVGHLASGSRSAVDSLNSILNKAQTGDSLTPQDRAFIKDLMGVSIDAAYERTDKIAKSKLAPYLKRGDLDTDVMSTVIPLAPEGYEARQRANLKPGEEYNGFRYLGGDKKKATSWKKL